MGTPIRNSRVRGQRNGAVLSILVGLAILFLVTIAPGSLFEVGFWVVVGAGFMLFGFLLLYRLASKASDPD